MSDESKKIFPMPPEMLSSSMASSTFGVPPGFAGATGTFGTSFSPAFPRPPEVHELETKIRDLHRMVSAQANQLRELANAHASAEEYRQKNAELEKNVSDLQKEGELRILLDRVNQAAVKAIMANEDLRQKFLGGGSQELYAMSVDIRRSTELMLKARTPEAFATFLTSLCGRLLDVVRSRHGVIDKFTGDGILCFFPKFFSGPDAGYYALATADACHAVFDKHYRESRPSFTSVLSEVGLGIGIDYGSCHLVQVAGTLTIVGAPVVYACRFGGAPAGKTLLNQGAYDALTSLLGTRIWTEETTIDLKHEGKTVAYSAKILSGDYEPQKPAWLKLQESPNPGDADRQRQKDP
jgi:class 3 adenylate cyclase